MSRVIASSLHNAAQVESSHSLYKRWLESNRVSKNCDSSH